MERRKDNKGKVLKEGESQRKDGRYQYRTTLPTGKRVCVYASSLLELREKEKEIQLKVALKRSVEGSKITVYEISKKHIAIREKSWKRGTLRDKKRYLAIIGESDFGQYKISDVKYTDALLWAKELYESGYSYGMVNSILSLARPAFNMACQDKIIDSNPFSFKLSDIIQKSSAEKYALTKEEYEKLVNFMVASPSKVYKKRLDEIVILYETGLRASELCGLTFNDVDLENKKLYVTHQLQWCTEDKCYIETPKSKSGLRTIPLSQTAVMCFQNVIKNRKALKAEPMIDGYTGFLFLTNRGNPQRECHVNQHITTIVNNYNACHDESLPHITPHTFRHTFCSRLISDGVDLKSVQYLMGHATSQMTLNVYTHVVREVTADQISQKCLAIFDSETPVSLAQQA